MDWNKAKKELEKKLDPSHVKPPPQGKYGEYIEGWHAIAEANRIFGFGGWTDEYSHELVSAETNAKGNNVVTYMCKARVTVDGVVREGFGTGEGIAKMLGAAHEGAIKEAETDALKRALRKFGNPFGLALYDKTKASVGREIPQAVLDAAMGAETLESLVTVWNANKEWQTDPEFQAAKDTRKIELTKEAA